MVDSPAKYVKFSERNGCSYSHSHLMNSSRFMGCHLGYPPWTVSTLMNTYSGDIDLERARGISKKAAVSKMRLI